MKVYPGQCSFEVLHAWVAPYILAPEIPSSRGPMAAAALEPILVAMTPSGEDNILSAHLLRARL